MTCHFSLLHVLWNERFWDDPTSLTHQRIRRDFHYICTSQPGAGPINNIGPLRIELKFLLLLLRNRCAPGGDSYFFCTRRLRPPFTVHPPKKSRISSTPKNIWNFSNPKKISQFCTLTLKKDPKLHRNDPQTSPILWWPPKISTKSSYPKNIHFSENPKKVLKFRILNPKKWADPTYMWKYQSTPPGRCVRTFTPEWLQLEL